MKDLKLDYVKQMIYLKSKTIEKLKSEAAALKYLCHMLIIKF
jgi:hypothetical protein